MPQSTHTAAETADRILNVRDAARFLGVAEITLYKNYPALPHYRVGRAIRFSENALREWRDSHYRPNGGR